MGAMNQSIHQADEFLMMWEDFLNPRTEKGGGSLWNYFFYSLLLGDNINWGGGGGFLNSVNQGSPLMRVILYKNGTQWVKAEPIQKKLRPTTQGGIY